MVNCLKQATPVNVAIVVVHVHTNAGSTKWLPCNRHGVTINAELQCTANIWHAKLNHVWVCVKSSQAKLFLSLPKLELDATTIGGGMVQTWCNHAHVHGCNHAQRGMMHLHTCPGDAATGA